MMMVLAFAGGLIGNLAMLIAGVVWLIAELWGVFTGSKDQKDTTSQWLWMLEAKYPVLRVLIGTFVLSLFAHFMWGTWLLP